MEESHKAFLITIGIGSIIMLLAIIFGILLFDSVGNEEIMEKNITVIGKICGEKILGSTRSSIQDNDGIVYGATMEDCKKYNIGSNYTIRYKTIRSSLCGML